MKKKERNPLDLNDLIRNPDGYAWIDFKPNLKKHLLYGTADTRHISVLWYTARDVPLPLHYHAKTEAVFVIDGVQRDACGTYPTGVFYFNQPGSGHAIDASTGFFLLAYASPPDFENTALIQERPPIRMDTADFNQESALPFQMEPDGVESYPVPLDPSGGMTATVLKLPPRTERRQRASCLLVLNGRCSVDRETLDTYMMKIAEGSETQEVRISTNRCQSCTLVALSFV